MSWLESVYDLVLCTGLLWLAWWTVTVDSLFASAVLFMAFGLLMAVVWGRLGAPDLALAEAIIGAGITGALLLKTCTALRVDGTAQAAGGEPEPSPGLSRPVLALFCALVGIGLALLMIAVLAEPADRTAALVGAAADTHVLHNPVTAVLLDFRGYDTLLEMAVLFAAFLGARSLLDQIDLPPLYAPTDEQPPMLAALAAVITPLLLLTALFLYWSGSHAPGGAFQAGALLGALGVMYRLAGRLESLDETPAGIRWLLVLGLLVFAGFACVSLLWASAPLTHPAWGGYALALGIEAALTISIAVTLILLFSATPGLRLTKRPWQP